VVNLRKQVNMTKATRACDVGDCDRKHLARGLCSMHYKRKHATKTKYQIVCEVCGSGHAGSRPTQRFCSDACKGVAYQTERRTTSRELVHVGPAYPVTWLPPQHPVIRGVAKAKRRTWYCGSCAWCGEGYSTLFPQGRYCSRRCLRAQARADYRLSRGAFAVSRRVRLSIYERDAWTCQLCMESVDQDLMTTDPQNEWAPSLDHIECQAWALVADHSPNNLRLAHRWCNSVRGDGRWHPEDILRAPRAA
jgi:predicted nucleic acid-binding Zn ribbon protein